MPQQHSAAVAPLSRPGDSYTRFLDVAAYLALACAIVGLPFCVWLLASYLSEFGPEWLYWLLTQNRNDPVRKVIDSAQLIGLCMSAAGLLVGGLLVWWSRRRGAQRPAARWALILGIAGVSLVAIGVATMLVAFFVWQGPA